MNNNQGHAKDNQCGLLTLYKELVSHPPDNYWCSWLTPDIRLVWSLNNSRGGLQVVWNKSSITQRIIGMVIDNKSCSQSESNNKLEQAENLQSTELRLVIRE